MRNRDIATVLEMANSGQPLRIRDIYRLLLASGVELPKERRFTQIVAKAEEKLFEGLLPVIRELDQLRAEPPERQPRGRRNLRRVLV